jgi:hypothetical protein
MGSRAGVTIGVLYIATLVILSQRLVTGFANRIRDLVGVPEFIEQKVASTSLRELQDTRT